MANQLEIPDEFFQDFTAPAGTWQESAWRQRAQRLEAERDALREQLHSFQRKDADSPGYPAGPPTVAQVEAMQKALSEGVIERDELRAQVFTLANHLNREREWDGEEPQTLEEWLAEAGKRRRELGWEFKPYAFMSDCVPMVHVALEDTPSVHIQSKVLPVSIGLDHQDHDRVVGGTIENAKTFFEDLRKLDARDESLTKVEQAARPVFATMQRMLDEDGEFECWCSMLMEQYRPCAWCRHHELGQALRELDGEGA